jgi:uncharacterized protein with HEPN domain
MSNPVLTDLIKHISTAAQKCINYTDGMEQIDFNCDQAIQDAVLMNLIIIGEATTRLIQNYPSFIEENKTVPWHAMRGMRNQVAHGYFDVDLDVIWTTINASLPELLVKLDSLNYPAPNDETPPTP